MPPDFLSRVRNTSRLKTQPKGNQGSRTTSQCCAADLRGNGIVVEAHPLPDDPGHAQLPDLYSANRKDDVTLERQRRLVALTLRIEGPFA